MVGDGVMVEMMPARPELSVQRYRRREFGKLGFRGDLKIFLADSNIDIAAVRRLIAKGADPLVAVRLEAGRNAMGENDPYFDHRRFEELVKPT